MTQGRAGRKGCERRPDRVLRAAPFQVLWTAGLSLSLGCIMDRAGERQEETVEESLEQSRKLKPPWKASHVGTARMLLEHVEEKGGLGLTSARKE